TPTIVNHLASMLSQEDVQQPVTVDAVREETDGSDGVQAENGIQSRVGQHVRMFHRSRMFRMGLKQAAPSAERGLSRPVLRGHAHAHADKSSLNLGSNRLKT